MPAKAGIPWHHWAQTSGTATDLQEGPLGPVSFVPVCVPAPVPENAEDRRGQERSGTGTDLQASVAGWSFPGFRLRFAWAPCSGNVVPRPLQLNLGAGGVCPGSTQGTREASTSRPAQISDGTQESSNAPRLHSGNVAATSGGPTCSTGIQV